MKKKHILIAVIAVLAAAAVGITSFILYKNYNVQNTAKKYNEAASSYIVNTTGATDPAKKNLPPNPINFTSLQERNADIFGWIKVPSTQVDYPLLQNEYSDSFYIDHDLDGNYAFAGSIYMQQCNHKTMLDRVTVLYGHNMADNSMFASLHQFEDSAFFEKNKKMTIYLPDKQLDYEIISAFVYDDRHIMNSFDFANDAKYQEFIDDVLHPRSISANVREGAEVGMDDCLVVLSTCLNAGDGRYLVVGKLTKETELQLS